MLGGVAGDPRLRRAPVGYCSLVRKAEPPPVLEHEGRPEEPSAKRRAIRSARNIAGWLASRLVDGSPGCQMRTAVRGQKGMAVAILPPRRPDGIPLHCRVRVTARSSQPTTSAPPGGSGKFWHSAVQSESGYATRAIKRTEPS